MEREGDGLRSVSLSDQVLEHYGRGERVKKRGAKASLRRLLFPGCGRRSSEQTETDETLFRQCGRNSQLTKHGLTKQQHLAPEPAGGRVHARLPCIRREKTSSESARRRGRDRGRGRARQECQKNGGRRVGKKILEALASGWLAWSERRGVGRHGGGLERVEGLGEQRGHGETMNRRGD